MSDVNHLFELSQRVAIITGGTGPLGREFAKTLAQAGASVVETVAPPVLGTAGRTAMNSPRPMPDNARAAPWTGQGGSDGRFGGTRKPTGHWKNQQTGHGAPAAAGGPRDDRRSQREDEGYG